MKLSATATEHRREIGVGLFYLAVLLVIAVLRPDFYAVGNLRNLLVRNAVILLPALGMTFVIVARQIDISIGSQYAVCIVVAAMLAVAGLPVPLVFVVTMLLGALLGAVNGWLVAAVGIPSIIVTLATMVAWRGALRWAMQGEYVSGLPPSFVFFGLGAAGGQMVIAAVALVVLLLAFWAARELAAARAVYAVGCDAEAARLAGLRPAAVTAATFVLLGMATALAAALTAVQFQQVPSSEGMGLELRVIAGVVVGGTAVTGGRGTIAGTLLGVLLLGTIGTVLTFLGINPAWEKAIAGLILLAAVTVDSVAARGGRAA